MAKCKDCFHWKVCKETFELTFGRKIPDDYQCDSDRCVDFIAAADVVPRAEVTLNYSKNTIKGEWISVADRLPDRPGTYLVYTYRGRIGTCYCYDAFCNGELNFDDYAITHWMPLPAPPKKEGE